MSDNQLPELMEVEVGSSNQIKSNIKLTKIPSLNIGNLEIKNIGALNLDFEESPSIKCYTNGGLIGKSIMKNGVWQINTQNNKIIITDNINRLSNFDNATKIKVKFDKVYNPFIKAKLNGKTHTFLLDFGFGGFLSLTENTGESIDTESTIEVIGEGSTSANGILEESTFVKSIREFSIGDQKINDLHTYYSKSNNYDLIGTAITNHFIVTLNFEQKELYLTPITKDSERKTKENESFGFSLNKNADTIYVSSLFKGGPAEKAGLRLKDVILSMNGEDLSNSAYCDFYTYFKGLLKANNDIALKLKRGDSEQTLSINKKQLFE